MWNWLEKLTQITETGTAAVVVTVIATKGSVPREVGAKMIVAHDGSISGTIGGGKLEHMAIQDALKALESGTSSVNHYPLCIKTGQCCGGQVDLFMEVFNTGPQLYLFGAGHVSRAICQTLEKTLFKIHVIDERSEWLESPELPSTVVRQKQSWEEFVKSASWNATNTYAAVMTHSHQLDQEILKEIIKKPSRYVGLIGSDTKWTRFKHHLKQQGFQDENLARVKCPIGLFRAGKAPHEIAISFAAELIQDHYEQTST